MRLLIHHDRPEMFLDLLKTRFPRIEMKCCTDYALLPALLGAFEPEVLFGIRFAGTKGFPRAAILATASLKWLSVGGSGTDHMSPWDPKVLTVTNAAGVASDMMAQYVLGAILSLTLGFPRFDRHRRARRWIDGTVAGIDGRTVTVVGLGKTGRDVARRVKSVGLRVVGVRANPRPTEHVDRVFGSGQLHEALGEGDYVVICVPLTGETRHLIDARAIEAMKAGAFLVDVSRGAVVHGAALIEALGSGRIVGAALDVFETEPLPGDSPFWDLDNVILTPHCSGVYEGWERRSMEMFCANLERWMRGAPLLNIVDPERGY